jgi:hypothetical protein
MNIEQLKTLAEQAAIFQEKDTFDIDRIIKTFETSFGSCFPVDAIEKLLEVYKKRLSDIVRVKIPEIMNEAEITDVTLDNGVKLSLKKGLSPQVVDKEKEIAWIEKIGFGESVKTELKFGKGEVNEDLEKFLEENGYSFSREDNVHFQTLSKIIRDRYESGDGLPPADAIKVTPFDEVKIK